MTEAWRVFRNMPRPVSLRDIADRTGMSENEAQKCICRLKASECIAFVHGSARTGRYYVAIPGKAPPTSDGRGKHPNSKAALERAYSRRRAARPVSPITAARSR